MAYFHPTTLSSAYGILGPQKTRAAPIAVIALNLGVDCAATKTKSVQALQHPPHTDILTSMFWLSNGTLQIERAVPIVLCRPRAIAQTNPLHRRSLPESVDSTYAAGKSMHTRIIHCD